MFEVLEGGLQTTVQDYPGRVGYLDLGTYPAGPMDHFAFRIANLLVGNPQGAPALEVTAGGLKARFHDGRSRSPAPTCSRRSTARRRRSGRPSPSAPTTCSS